MIFYSLKEVVHVRRTTGTVGHFVCKIADTQLVYDFSISALNRGPNPVHVIFSLFFFNIHVPLYSRVGNLQPFAHIHKSWPILVCNVVLGLMVEFRSVSSVDSAYKLTHTHTDTNNNTQTHTYTHILSFCHHRSLWAGRPKLISSIFHEQVNGFHSNTHSRVIYS